MRALEKDIIATGIAPEALIQTVGTACALAIRQQWPELRRVFVCAGPGNNGADALVCAAALARANISVTLISWHRPLADSWLIAARTAGADYIENWDVEAIQSLVPHVNLIVDGLLGIGLNRPPVDILAQLIDALNARSARLPLIAIDIPSGCDAATGEIPGVAIRADFTLSTGPVKVGLLLLPASLHTGPIIELKTEITIPAYDRRATRLLDRESVRTLLPIRPVDSYKGTYGIVCVWAGSSTFPGAAQLACLATARSGAGIVALAAAPDVIPLAWPTPEVTLVPLTDNPHDALMQSQFSTYLVGPGIGRSNETAALLHSFLSSADLSGRPVVIDADALTLLARIPEWQSVIATLPCVLTPHYGELRRLAGGQCESLPPVELAQHYARSWNQVIVMKGSVTVIASPDGRASLWAHPNPALAVAGSGDVLAGIVAAYIAQHCDLYSAACLAVAVHGMAGQKTAAVHGSAGVLAGELAAAIPAVVQELRAQ